MSFVDQIMALQKTSRGTLSPATDLQKRALRTASATEQGALQASANISSAVESVSNEVQGQIKHNFRGSSGVISRPGSRTRQIADDLSKGKPSPAILTTSSAQGPQPSPRPGFNPFAPRPVTVGIGPVMEFNKKRVDLYFDKPMGPSLTAVINRANGKIKSARGRLDQWNKKLGDALDRVRRATGASRQKAEAAAEAAAQKRADAAYDLRQAQLEEWAARQTQKALESGDSQRAQKLFNTISEFVYRAERSKFENKSAQKSAQQARKATASPRQALNGLGSLGQNSDPGYLNLQPGQQQQSAGFLKDNSDALIQGGVSFLNNLVSNLFGNQTSGSPPPATGMPQIGRPVPPTMTAGGQMTSAQTSPLFYPALIVGGALGVTGLIIAMRR